MQMIHRRSFLQLALSLVPTSLLAQVAGAVTGAKAARVAAGTDREGKKRTIGVSSTTYKVLTADTDGAMFVMEQLNQKKGGPSRHLHHAQDELFYAIEGDYIVEIGPERVYLKAGDCVLGPRGIPHAWAFAGEGQGRLLISFAPAGKMEAFFNQRAKLGLKPGEYASGPANAAIMREFGMELVGPPLVLD